MSAKKLGLLLTAMACCFGLFNMAAASADTKPYFKVFGGDVMSGGEFDTKAPDCGSGNSDTSNCSSANSVKVIGCNTGDANYQAPTFNPIKNQYEGGILSYATGDRKGSSTNFGALSLGLVQGDNTNQYGFFSGITSTTNSLTFSNTNNQGTDYWGGYLAGNTPQIHCIPDYFDTKLNTSPAPTTVGTSFNVGALTSGNQYLAPRGLTSDITAGGQATISGSLTVFVEGNAYISHNIVYSSGYSADNIPKFALVVKGNIFVDPSVTEIDGLYIAQPSSGSSDGNIWTCHDSSNSITNGYGYWIQRNCKTKLTVKGALIAKQTILNRINGDLASAPASESSGSGNVAEEIDFTPEMTLGGAFFNQSSSSTSPRIDSLISLPPVF